VGLFLVGVLLVFFWDAAVGGRVLAGSDAIFATPVFRDVAPDGFAAPSNELLFDSVYQFLPWRKFACDSLRRGELPLWNPYSACGTPFMATMQSAVLYPVNVALCALPFHRIPVWSAIVRLWIAGFSTYVLMRAYALAVLPALVSAVAFMLCGFLVVWLEHPHVNVAVWLPAMILFAERLVTADGRTARVRALALLALVTGVQLTGGHVETSVHVLLVVGVYYAIRWYQLGTANPSRLALPVVAIALGAALAAVQLMPFVEWLPLSAELGRRSSAALPVVDTSFLRHLAALPLLVFPNLYGNPTWGIARPFAPVANYNETILYVGTATLLLAIVAVADVRRGGPVACWTLLAVASAGMALRLPVIDWLNRLPVLGLAYPPRLRLVTAFGLCVLAGFGAALVGDRARTALFRRSAATVVIAGVLLAIVANVALPRMRDRIVSSGRAIAERQYAALPHPSRPLAYYHTEVDRLADGLVAAFRPDDVAMYAPVVWALAAALVVPRLRTPRARHAALLAVVVADAVTFGRHYHPTVPVAEFYPPTPVTSRIAADGDLHRVTAVGETMIPDVQMMYGLADVRGLDFRTAWYDRYLGLVRDRLRWIPYGVLLDGASSPLLRVLNLAYVVTPRDAPAVDGGSVVYQGRDVSLIALARPQPRSFMIYDAVSVADDAEAVRALEAAPDAVSARVVLSVPPGTSAAVPDNTTASPTHAVSLRAYAPSRATWHVATAEAGYLVSTDAYYPGWYAYVDGDRVPLLRANVAFRAVYVPAGEHDVSFRYEPAWLRYAVGVAVASAVLIVAMLLTGRSRARGASP